MKKKLYKLIRTLHAWGGVTLALLLILSSVTGSLLVWKPEYVKLTIPESWIDFEPTPEALADIAAAVEAQFDNDEILQIQFPTEVFPLAKVTLYDTNYAYVDTKGKVVSQWHENDRFEEWLYDLHHRLLLENLGLTIVGFAAMALVILVLAGIITFIPLRRHFIRGIWPANFTRFRLILSHRNLGIILALPLLLTLITGIILAFPQQAESILLEEVRSTEKYSNMMVEKVDNITGGNSGDWLPAMQRALATFPSSTIRSAQVPNSFSLYRIIGIQQPGDWNPNGLSSVYIDSELGYMDIRIDTRILPLIERTYNSGYPLHTGKTGSILYKLILSISGLGIAFLSGLGLISFLKSKFRMPVS